MTTTKWKQAKEIKAMLRNEYGMYISDEIALQVLDNPMYHSESDNVEIYEMAEELLWNRGKYGVKSSAVMSVELLCQEKKNKSNLI